MRLRAICGTPAHLKDLPRPPIGRRLPHVRYGRCPARQRFGRDPIRSPPSLSLLSAGGSDTAGLRSGRPFASGLTHQNS